MVLRPMPSFCAASMRRPRLAASAARISVASKRRVNSSHTSRRPLTSKALASASKPGSQAPALMADTASATLAPGSASTDDAGRDASCCMSSCLAVAASNVGRGTWSDAIAVTPISGGKSFGSITCAGAITVSQWPVSYTHLRAHETGRNLVCRLLLEKKKKEHEENTTKKEAEIESFSGILYP